MARASREIKIFLFFNPEFRGHVCSLMANIAREFADPLLSVDECLRNAVVEVFGAQEEDALGYLSFYERLSRLECSWLGCEVFDRKMLHFLIGLAAWDLVRDGNLDPKTALDPLINGLVARYGSQQAPLPVPEMQSHGPSPATNQVGMESIEPGPATSTPEPDGSEKDSNGQPQPDLSGDPARSNNLVVPPATIPPPATTMPAATMPGPEPEQERDARAEQRLVLIEAQKDRACVRCRQRRMFKTCNGSSPCNNCMAKPSSMACKYAARRFPRGMQGSGASE